MAGRLRWSCGFIQGSEKATPACDRRWHPLRRDATGPVVDQYQGQGIGAALVRHLIGIARAVGITELTAEVLPDNAQMLRLFERCGLPLRKRREAEVVHVILQLS